MKKKNRFDLSSVDLQTMRQVMILHFIVYDNYVPNTPVDSILQLRMPKYTLSISDRVDNNLVEISEIYESKIR